MQNKWYQELSKASGMVMAHQLNMSEIVTRNKKYKVDINKGIISFGFKKFKIQVLGTESDESNTWLWGWANDIFSEDSLKAAKELKDKGKELGLEQFFTDKLEITEQINGETISILACALIEQDVCFYSIKEGKETVYFLIYGLSRKIFGNINYDIFLKSISYVTKHFEVDHKLLIENMLEKSGTGYKWNDNMIIADDINAKISYEEINGVSRISSIENVITRDWIVFEDTYANKMTKHFTQFIDFNVVDLQIKYFGDEISIIVDCENKTYQVIKFELCQYVEYETDANWGDGEWRKDMLVKDMEKGQLGYSFQDITVKTSKKYKGMYNIYINLGIFIMKVVCKKISSETISQTEYLPFGKK